MNSPLYNCDDPQKNEDRPAFSETTCGEDVAKWDCIQTHVSTLFGVLCWADQPTYTNPLQRTQDTGPSMASPPAMQCNNNRGECGHPGIHFLRRVLPDDTGSTMDKGTGTGSQHQGRV